MKRGFTLIELVVAVGILGLLASFVVLQTQGSQQKARDNKRTADLYSIQTALELYFADNKVYPATVNGNFECWDGRFSRCVNTTLTTALVPRYIAKLPDNPSALSSYVYHYLSNGSIYAIQTGLEASNYTTDSVYGGANASTLGNFCGYLDNRTSDNLIYFRICSVR